MPYEYGKKKIKCKWFFYYNSNTIVNHTIFQKERKYINIDVY